MLLSNTTKYGKILRTRLKMFLRMVNWDPEPILTACSANQSCLCSIFYRHTLNITAKNKLFFTWSNLNYSSCGVFGCKMDGCPRNHKVLSPIPRSGCQLWGCSEPLLVLSFQQEQFWEISISCKNLSLNPCKINILSLVHQIFFFFSILELLIG